MIFKAVGAMLVLTGERGGSCVQMIPAVSAQTWRSGGWNLPSVLWILQESNKTPDPMVVKEAVEVYGWTKDKGGENWAIIKKNG